MLPRPRLDLSGTTKGCAKPVIKRKTPKKTCLHWETHDSWGVKDMHYISSLFFSCFVKNHTFTISRPQYFSKVVLHLRCCEMHDPFYLHEQRLGWRIPDQTMVTCVWLIEEWCLPVIQRRANNMDACPLVLKGISFSKPPDMNFVITLGMVSTDEDCTMIQCQ